MDHYTLLQFLLSHFTSLEVKLFEHIYLALSATLIAVIIGVPLGIWINRYPRFQGIALGVTSIFQTIPSLALLAFLIPFLGIGIKPTIVTLTVYALLPITRNTFTSLQGIPSKLIEAADGLGFTRNQRLLKVELPLALPIIVAGIRTATTMTIGITTIAAFIGAGGLGDFITQGLALDSTPLILLGAIPTALLALSFDYLIAQIENYLSRSEQITMHFKKLKFIIGCFFIFTIIGGLNFFIFETFSAKRNNTILIASKNFTEQYILANIMAALIKAKTHLHVITKLNLGTTTVAHNAIMKGEIDLYPEYTGTAYMVVLHRSKILSPKKTFHIVKNKYKNKFNLLWLQPFGFNNSQILAVTQQFAKKYHLNTLSDLASISDQLTIAAPAEFIKRPDALPGLSKAYNFRFKKILQIEPDLMYDAIKHGDVDVIEVFTTDARIQAYNLKILKDDKHFYPPYYAAPVIRASVLRKYPNLVHVLALLAGLIDNKTMKQLNYQVQILKKSPVLVAHNFLKVKLHIDPMRGR